MVFLFLFDHRTDTKLVYPMSTVADWVLETHGVDAAELYLNKNTLQKYNHYAL
jgi:hypothetical protein